jgi:hypothetical protein
MAVITITEILGGDNIAGSRITINDNFKRLANAINTIETRLDTSFNPGGSLNVGNALIKKYTNPTSAQIFTCEATGVFQGNLNVLLDLGVTQNITGALNLTVGRNVTFDGSAVGGPHVFNSQIRSNFQNEVVLQQLYTGTPTAPVLNPQTLAQLPSATNRAIASVVGHSVLRIDLSTYDSTIPAQSCNSVQLPAGTNGQVLTVIIDTISPNLISDFQLDTTSNFDPGYSGTPIRIGVINTPNTAGVKKLAVTLFYSTTGWRVLSVAQPVAGDIDYN